MHLNMHYCALIMHIRQVPYEHFLEIANRLPTAKSPALIEVEGSGGLGARQGSFYRGSGVKSLFLTNDILCI